MPEDRDRFSHGNPSTEYMNAKGYEKPREVFEQTQDVTSHDMLLAILCSADSIWSELHKIRNLLQERPAGESLPDDQG